MENSFLLDSETTWEFFFNAVLLIIAGCNHPKGDINVKIVVQVAKSLKDIAKGITTDDP